MANFLTSDWHLGDDRVGILGRPFADKNVMTRELVLACNAVVSPSDTLYVVGDVCSKTAPEYLHNVAKFNGKKILIRGNHDRGISDDDFSKYFDKIIPDGEGIEIEIDGIPCYIVHYPTEGKKDRFNLCGHVHSSWRHQLNMFNVGVDANHFMPVNFNNIIFQLNAITKHYDEDIWCAYNEINKSYIGKRGMAGTYFQKEKNK